jgi:hypothetical protein
MWHAGRGASREAGGVHGGEQRVARGRQVLAGLDREEPRAVDEQVGGARGLGDLADQLLELDDRDLAAAGPVDLLLDGEPRQGVLAREGGGRDPQRVGVEVG